MDARTAATAYTQSTFESAPPLKILRLLYEGAIKFLDQAEAIGPQERPADFTERVNRADAIVSELRLNLEPEHAPDLCDKLNLLYLFVESRLREAILDRSVEPLAPARKVLRTLLEGWEEIEISQGEVETCGRTGS